MTAPSLIDAMRADVSRHAPFDRMPAEHLDTLLGLARVRYVHAQASLFDEGAPAFEHFFVVKKGCIALRRAQGTETQLVDLSGDGDLFGVRALLSGAAYSAGAVAEEDSLVYEIPWEPFKQIMEASPPVALYFAAGFAAVLPPSRDQLMHATRDAQRSESNNAWADDPEREIQPATDVLTCSPDECIPAIAARMRDRGVGSVIIVNDVRAPVGILTDTDLRNKVLAAGLDPRQTRASDVMSAPVHTVKAPQTVAALMGEVMASGLRHFCFTEDGTAHSPVIGVASEHDLISAHHRHPSVLRQKMARADSPDSLRRYRDQVERMLARGLEHGAEMTYLCTVMAGIQDALIRSAIRIAQGDLETEGLVPPKLRFAWLSFGSEGRKEQLLRTDLDQAIVYDDPAPADSDAVQDYFLTLGARATDILVHAGYERCPGGIMANNPELTGSLSSWRQRFARWVRNPDPKALMLATIFFDLRPVYGEPALAQKLIEGIFADLKSERAFLNFFAQNALQNPPPLSFFRGFVVERSGDNSERFDIKARAMMPLTDAARVLTYDLGIDPTGDTTASRFRRIAEAEPTLGALAEEAAMAYEILARMRAQEGLRTGTSGRYIEIDRLNKLQRRTLRNTFAVIHDVQRALSSRYRLEMFR